MEKIGRIRTIRSIIPKEFEVIDLEGRLFAGKDAFSFPNNREDLRCLECLLIPEEWEWTQRLVIRDADYNKTEQPQKSKYIPVHGKAAEEKLLEILSRHETGCLTLFDDPYPYTIPINHAFREGRLYMHCAKKGKKLGLIRRSPYACYTIYGTSERIPEGVRSCHLPYESILFYGTVRISQDQEEKERAVRELTDQYGTPYEHGFADAIEILVFDIHHATARDGRFKPSSERRIYFYRP